MIELTTTLLLLASAFTPASAEVPKTEAISNDHPLTSISVEAYVRDYFADEPLLAEIAKCESGFRQFDSHGKVIRGEVNKSDIGILQINKYYHEEDAVKLGFDIYTIDGNLGYAKWLYAKYGDAPWIYSSKCWKKYKEIAQK
jgi:hypothetical protein